jgi:hypothetical protein
MLQYDDDFECQCLQDMNLPLHSSFLQIVHGAFPCLFPPSQTPAKFAWRSYIYLQVLHTSTLSSRPTTIFAISLLLLDMAFLTPTAMRDNGSEHRLKMYTQLWDDTLRNELAKELSKCATEEPGPLNQRPQGIRKHRRK